MSFIQWFCHDVLVEFLLSFTVTVVLLKGDFLVHAMYHSGISDPSCNGVLTVSDGDFVTSTWEYPVSYTKCFRDCEKGSSARWRQIKTLCTHAKNLYLCVSSVQALRIAEKNVHAQQNVEDSVCHVQEIPSTES
jgi:hypothetical protein